MKKAQVIIRDEAGLHARPASELVKKANQFESNIEIVTGEKKVNAKSMLAVMSAGVKANTEIEIICDGSDEEKAISEVVELLENTLDKEKEENKDFKEGLKYDTKESKESAEPSTPEDKKQEER